MMKLIGLLVISLIVFIGYSFSERKMRVFGVELEKTDAAKVFETGMRAVAIEKRRKIRVQRLAIKPKKAPQRLLFIGDSMIEGLLRRFNDYCKENNYSLQGVIWYGSTSKEWGSCDTLSYFIEKYDPTCVFICLGANELFIRDIKETRSDYVKHIISQAGDREFFWIGPPNWKPDTGINDLIHDHAGNAKFFPSKDLHFDRISDGAHPTMRSAAAWADTIVSWINCNACSPFSFDPAKKSESRMPATVLIKPAK
jgi:hypothetical protein